ncbi:hypothetical protein C8R43DRAFT_226270 [Mycena crocata]|nr:hypothetical protein C8R43DRAFT_226270 [Mycena crocata]
MTLPTSPPHRMSLFVLLLCLPFLSLPVYGGAVATPDARSTTNARSIPQRREESTSSGLLERLWPWRRAPTLIARAAPEFFSPVDAGGSMLTKAPGNPLGEPLNIILAGSSSPAVLIDSEFNGGFRNFFLSIDFASECLGQHQGDAQTANLGDGNGWKNETAVLRYDYKDPSLGTCQETIQGGNHFRYWVQNGKDQNTSAVFMATSYEKPIALGHDIVVDGYNLGRDWLVGNITKSVIPTAELTNASTFSGVTTFGGYTYTTAISYVSGLLPNSSDGVNHGNTVGINGRPALDGLVAILDVQITGKPAGTKDSAGLSASPPRFAATITTLGLLLLGVICI